MNFINITTPENIEIKYTLAGVLLRMSAFSVDFIIICIAIFNVLFYEFLTFYFAYNFNLELYTPSGWIIAFTVIITFFIFFGYFIISELVMKGQSPGKKIFKLRVIRENGQPITLTQSIIRNLFRYFIDIYGIGVIAAFFSKKCKRIGDMAASTIVVVENDSLLREHLTLSSIAAKTNIKIITNEKYILSEDEFYWLNEYYNRKDSFIDNGQNAKKALFTYFAKKYTLNEGSMNDEAMQKIFELNGG